MLLLHVRPNKQADNYYSLDIVLSQTGLFVSCFNYLVLNLHTNLFAQAGQMIGIPISLVNFQFVIHIVKNFELVNCRTLLLFSCPNFGCCWQALRQDSLCIGAALWHHL